MKTITKLLAATAFALSMSAASAQAAIFVGYSLDGGATINTVLVDPDDGTYSWAGANLGGFETITVDGHGDEVPALLHSDTVTVNASGAANLTIFITRTDLSAPDYHGFFSGFSGNTQFGDNYTVTMSTLFDAGNGQYTGSLLRTVTYTGFGADSDNFYDVGYDLSGTFSVTHRYDISTARGGSTSPSIVLGAVPEPATWALMIMGFGGAGAMLRRRRAAFA